MKKFLLGTTGLVASATLFASVAAAETPKVTVGGFIDFQAGIASDDLDSAQRAQGFRNDTEVNIRVDGKSDAGLGYGAEIDLEADVTADADGEGLNASRTFIFLDGNWGRFELGSNTGAAEALKVDASDVSHGTGGIDGDWSYFANQPTGSFITVPSLPVAHGSTLVAGGDETTDNDNKITYYSPRWSGFQLGVSYAPDQTDRGQTVTRLDNEDGEAGDIFSGGVNYAGQWDQITLAAALAGEWGDAETSATEDLRAWNAGAKVGYMGFAVAGSYGDWSDSLSVSGSDADYWTLGASYDYAAFGASVSYLDSSVEAAGGDNDFENIAVSADYKLAPGLTPYAEVSLYEYDAPGAGAADNDGTVFILGTQLAF